MAVNRLLYSTQSVFITVGGHLRASSNVFDYRLNNTASADGNNINGVSNRSGGFDHVMTFIMPVQSASVDETIPQDDVLVLGNLGGVKRLQKDVATSKCTLKAYLTENMQWHDGNVFRTEGHTESPTAATLAPGYFQDPSSSGWDENAAVSGQQAPGVNDPTDAQNVEYLDRGPFPGITRKGRLAGEAWICTCYPIQAQSDDGNLIVDNTLRLNNENLLQLSQSIPLGFEHSLNR